MACYHPLTGYRSRTLNASGKRSITFSSVDGFLDLPVTVPCGQCIGCRLEYSRQWAIRCVHEAQLHPENSFITLTYAPQHLPDPPTLVLEHYQLFMKRLRKHLGNKRVRFYHCGEYGETTFRPHYHAILFGHEFPDKTLYSQRKDIKLYTSKTLERLWGLGFVTIGDVTFDSAAYVARYIMKKATGDLAKSHYERVDENSGEVINLKSEYVTMSRRPGIASGWYDKFSSDVFPSDEVVLNNKRMQPPKFYDKLLEQQHAVMYENVKARRRKRAARNAANSTPERLAIRKIVKLAQISQLPRILK